MAGSAMAAPAAVKISTAAQWLKYGHSRVYVIGQRLDHASKEADGMAAPGLLRSALQRRGMSMAVP